MVRSRLDRLSLTASGAPRRPPSATAARRHQPRRCISVGVITHATAAMPLIFLGTMGATIRGDLHFSETTLGLLAASLPLAAAAASTAAGRLCERISLVTSLRLAALGAALSMLGIGVFARSWLMIAPFLLVAGLTLAMAQPATDGWLTATLPDSIRARAFGIKQASAGPGVGLCAGLAVPLVEQTLGWRASFGVGAALALVLAVCLRRDAPRSRGQVLRELDGSTDLSMRPLVWLAVSGGLCTLPQAAFVTFAVSGAAESGMSRSSAGLLFAVACGVGFVARLALGELVGRRRTNALTVMAATLALAFAGFALFATGNQVAVWASVPLLAATVWGWHGLFFFAVAELNPSAPARASGIVSAGVLGGSVAGPLVFGLTVRFGYGVAWVTLGVLSLIGVGAILISRSIVQATVPAVQDARSSTRRQSR